MTVPWQKRLTSARRGERKGGGDGEGRGIYSRGSSCFDVNDEARDPLWISPVMNEWKEWGGRRRHSIDYAALYHRSGPGSVAPLSPLNGQSLRITREKNNTKWNKKERERKSSNARFENRWIRAGRGLGRWEFNSRANTNFQPIFRRIERSIDRKGTSDVEALLSLMNSMRALKFYVSWIFVDCGE